MKMKWNLVAFVALGLATSGCGAGKKLVRDLNFFNETVQGEQYAGFDAKLNLGIVQLPSVVLPIQNGLGEVQIGGDKIHLKLNVTQAVNFPVGDGTTLPNGREIPVALPTGAVAIGIPILGSNSKVYLSLSRTQIMAGVAISLKSDLSGIGSILGIPMNVFFPFDMDKNLRGATGIYTGEKFGIGLFAIKTVPSQQTIFASSVKGKFEPLTQAPSYKKMKKLNRALSDIRRLSLD